jgi:hypothetical protein
MYGTSETTTLLSSTVGLRNSPLLLRTYSGYSYRFVPTVHARSDLGDESTIQLLELVIPAESPDCPDVSLRHSDGDFHTGDLFQEASPGLYLFRGRDGDWITSDNAVRCDTKCVFLSPWILNFWSSHCAIIGLLKTAYCRCVVT